jgi:hypothetical protein
LPLTTATAVLFFAQAFVGAILSTRGFATDYQIFHALTALALWMVLVALVVAAGYLAKDAVTRAADFALMTPRLDEWHTARDRWDPRRRFRSAQSVRLFGDPA